VSLNRSFAYQLVHSPHQEEVQPVLYRHIDIDTGEMLSLFAHSLRMTDMTREPKSTHIRTLAFIDGVVTYHEIDEDSSGFNCEAPSLAIDLMTILLGAVNLESLSAHMHYALASLTISSRISATTLRHLDVKLHSDIRTVPSLGYISRFVNLRELSVNIKVEQAESPLFLNIPAWSLTRLVKFRIKSTFGGGGRAPLLQYLARCHFPALLELDMCIRIPHYWAEEASDPLCIFFDTLQHLEEAKIEINHMEDRRFLRHLSVPCLGLVPLDATVISSLLPMTHMLCINTSSLFFDSISKTLDFLQSNETQINIVRLYGNGFSWSGSDNTRFTESDRIAALIRRNHAAKLLQRGIWIVDGDDIPAMDHLITF
jgi:hypothetical protein